MINFWDNFDFKKLKEHHDRDLYPPRMKMTIILTGPKSVVFPLRFQGCSSDSGLDADLVLTSPGMSTCMKSMHVVQNACYYIYMCTAYINSAHIQPSIIPNRRSLSSSGSEVHDVGKLYMCTFSSMQMEFTLHCSDYIIQIGL